MRRVCAGAVTNSVPFKMVVMSILISFERSIMPTARVVRVIYIFFEIREPTLRERSYAKMQALKRNPLRPQKGLEVDMTLSQRSFAHYLL